MAGIVKSLWKEENGQDLTEYALLITLIALSAVVALKIAGQAISDAFSTAATNLTTNT
jgi:pilus assembly protein Flp/PilA